MISPSSHYLINRLLCSPSEVLFTLMIFILSKNLHATPLQLTLLASIKPITSLFSYYISTLLHNKSYLIRPYLMMNNLIGALPCFFYPFTDNVWFYIGSYAVYMITKRAQDPAWIEYLRGGMELPYMGKTVSRGLSMSYFVSMFFPFILAGWLEAGYWKIIFIAFAFLQTLNLINIFLLKSISRNAIQSSRQSFKLNHILFKPIKSSFQLLKQDTAFLHYLCLFFLGGAGIIAMQPLLPEFFNHYLGISYMQLTFAFSFCKGISFLISSPIWAKYANRISLYKLNALANLLTCLFIAGLFAAIFGTDWLYAGYLCYGAMQGGSELSWNISGPVFSKEKNSTPYSSLNLVLVGVRGCIFPFLGFILYVHIGMIPVFALAFTLCIMSFAYGLWLDGRHFVKRLDNAQEHSPWSFSNT